MNFARDASKRVEFLIDQQATALVSAVKRRIKEQIISDVLQLQNLLAQETDPKIKGQLAALLSLAKQAESLSEGKKKRVVMFRPCVECKQEEGKIDECKRCHGCGIDPEFQVRIFEDPRNPLNEIIPPVRRPVEGG